MSYRPIQIGAVQGDAMNSRGVCDLFRFREIKVAL